MKIAIVNKSSVDMLNNWSAEFNIGEKELIDIVLSYKLSIEDYKFKLNGNIYQLRGNRGLVRIILLNEKQILSSIIGGYANNPNMITVDKVFSFLDSSLNSNNKSIVIKGLIVSMILIKSIKNNVNDIERFINEELKRILLLKSSLKSIIERDI